MLTIERVTEALNKVPENRKFWEKNEFNKDLGNMMLVLAESVGKAAGAMSDARANGVEGSCLSKTLELMNLAKVEDSLIEVASVAVVIYEELSGVVRKKADEFDSKFS